MTDSYTLYFLGKKVYASDMPSRLIAIATVDRVNSIYEFAFEDQLDMTETARDAESMLRAVAVRLTRTRLQELIRAQPNLGAANVLDLQSGPLFRYVPTDADVGGRPPN